MTRPIPGQLAFNDEFLSEFTLPEPEPIPSVVEGMSDA